jgi:hypothetical protein
MNDDAYSPNAVRNRADVPTFEKGEFVSAAKLNRLASVLRALSNPTISSGLGNDVKLSDSNIHYVIKDSDLTGGSGAKVSGPYRIKSVQTDWVTCRTWDGTTEGATDVYVMKEWKVRCSLVGETIMGYPHTYTYRTDIAPDPLNIVRIDSAFTTLPDTSEQQVVIPPWTVDEEIYAVSGSTPGNAASGLIMIGRSAQWAKVGTVGGS